jgi:predicted transposase/invertase (TIGR01784 family)
MAIGIYPTVDFVCKKLLGSPDHPAVTLHFLNAVLQGQSPIAEVTILNPFLEKEFDADKLSILDIRARDAAGRWIDIEVQRTLPSALPERLTFYAASQLVDQIGEGNAYTDLRPSIGICILDAVLFPQVCDFHFDFLLRNHKHSLLLTDCLQIHLLELPKYMPPSDNKSINSPIEQWAFFFRRANELSANELIARLPDPVFQEATGILEMIAKDPHQRSLYNERLKMERDQAARLQAATAEGEARGAIRGRIELLHKLLLMEPFTAEKSQGLTLDELNSLEQELIARMRQSGHFNL